MSQSSHNNAPVPAKVTLEPIAVPPLPYTFHADISEYKRRIGIWRVLIALFITTLFFIQYGVLVWSLVVIGLVGGIGGAIYALSRRHVTITDTEIEYRSMFGRCHVLRFDEIDSVKVFLLYLEAGFGVTSRVSIARKGAKAPLVFVGIYWPLEQLDILVEMCRQKDASVEHYTDLTSSSIVVKHFSAYATGLERHPVLFAFVGTLVILSVGVGVALFISLSQ